MKGKQHKERFPPPPLRTPSSPRSGRSRAIINACSHPLVRRKILRVVLLEDAVLLCVPHRRHLALRRPSTRQNSTPANLPSLLREKPSLTTISTPRRQACWHNSGKTPSRSPPPSPALALAGNPRLQPTAPGFTKRWPVLCPGIAERQNRSPLVKSTGGLREPDPGVAILCKKVLEEEHPIQDYIEV